MKKITPFLLFVIFFFVFQTGFAEKTQPEIKTVDLPYVHPQLPRAPALDETIIGTTPGGAHFKIIKPDSYTGELVIWNHGFSLDPAGPVTDMGPLVDLQLSEGYAVAASSYQQSGWALFGTVADLQYLVAEFAANFGAPNQVFIYGASLGGAVTAQALEKANLGNVVGAFSLCGALAGSRNWDGALDLRLIYDVVAADVPGGAIPGGAEGLPEGSNFDELDLLLAVDATTGILAPPGTPEQQANLAQILNVTQIPESFLLTAMGYATFALSDLTHDAAKLGGRIGIGNTEIVYNDGEIDANIARVAPDPLANHHLGQHFTPMGSVGGVKIIALQTDKDGLVIVENMSEYAAVVPPANLTQAIVVEDDPSHCDFTEAEVLAGWESLRAWVAGVPQPSPASLQATCDALVAGGLAVGPCRIDPDFVVPDMDGRMPPRTRWQATFLPGMPNE